MWLTTSNYKPADRFFDDFFTPAQKVSHNGLSVYDKDNVLSVKADLPGLEKKDINLEVKDGNLNISADRKVEIDEKAKVYTWGTADYQFSRSIKLPYAVDEGKIDAQYESGVLTVSLPRSEESKPKQIVVN